MLATPLATGCIGLVDTNRCRHNRDNTGTVDGCVNAATSSANRGRQRAAATGQMYGTPRSPLSNTPLRPTGASQFEA